MAAVARARGAAPAAPAAAPRAASKPAQAPAIFAALDRRLAEKPGLKEEVRAVVAFKITDPDATFTYDLAGGGGAPTTTFTISDADLAALAGGKASAKDLYQHGKLRVDGDVAVAHRLGFLKGLV
jgi:3-hydroxyacyl-CoA dehydrogenase/3a,7a,12a-trihydroxy-5b-cholest-24-enoyl-CoA hydratase